MANPLCQVVNIYVYCLFGRIILSYFPISPGSVMAGVFSFLYTITEPVLGPVRRLIPTGSIPIDFSPIIVFFGIRVIAGALFNC